MSVITHLKQLQIKHKELDEKLHEAYIHHLPTTEISKLKKQKLMLKDEIRNIEGFIPSLKEAA